MPEFHLMGCKSLVVTFMLVSSMFPVNAVSNPSTKSLIAWGVFLVSTVLFSCSNSGNTQSTVPDERTSSYPATSSVEGTIACLVDVDWVYPSEADLVGAWKFSGDGTFNSSTTLFGGMSTWGTWKVVNPGEVQIEYTRTTEGYLPENQVLKLSDCNRLYVGSTEYVKL